VIGGLNENKSRSGGDGQMRFVPIELAEANNFVLMFHRHNKPVKRAKFQIGMMEGNDNE